MKHLLLKRKDFRQEIKKYSTKKAIQNLTKFPVSTKDLYDVSEIPVLTESAVRHMDPYNFKESAKNGVIILLDVLGNEVGHFVCIWKNTHGWNYFDSYGSKIESPMLKEYFAGERVFYNSVRYQKPTLNTCGSHCCLRLAYMDLNEKEYYDKIIELITELGLTPDDLAMSMYVLDSED